MEGVVVPAVKRVPNPRSVPQRPNTEEKLKVSWKLKFLFVCKIKRNVIDPRFKNKQEKKIGNIRK